MNAFELNATNTPGGAYLIDGNDGFLVKTAESFFRSLVPEGSLALRVIDKLSSAEEISSSVGVYNFDGLPNVVIVRDPDAKLDEDGHSVLLSVLKRGVSPDYLVFGNASLLTAAEKKLVAVINCNSPDKYRCMQYAEKLFPYGIEKSAAALLADYTENNLAKIDKESKKLTAYCGQRAVKTEDVENLVAEDREIQIFAFADAAMNGNSALALKRLEKLRRYGVAPVKILATLSGQFQRMLFCSLSPLGDEELAEMLKVKPFAITKAREGKKIGTKRLKSTLEMLVDCEYRFKSGEISEQSALNIAVSKLLRKE